MGGWLREVVALHRELDEWCCPCTEDFSCVWVGCCSSSGCGTSNESRVWSIFIYLPCFCLVESWCFNSGHLLFVESPTLFLSCYLFTFYFKLFWQNIITEMSSNSLISFETINLIIFKIISLTNMIFYVTTYFLHAPLFC